MNITEDFCSYEVAKLLKEKGFPQEYDIYHSMVYNEEDYEDEYEVQRMVLETRLIKAGTLSSYPIGVPEPKCYCPTLQMAMKWLREEKDVYICVIPRTNYNTLTYEYSIWYYTACERKVNWGEGINLITEKEFCCPTWEEAIETALKYSLENLI